MLRKICITNYDTYKIPSGLAALSGKIVVNIVNLVSSSPIGSLVLQICGANPEIPAISLRDSIPGQRILILGEFPSKLL